MRLFLAPINSQSAASLMLRVRLRWQSKSQERLLDHEFSRSISFLFSHKDSSQRLMWALMMYRHYITKVRHRKDVLEGHTLFCLILFYFIFLQKMFARLTSLFLSYLHLKPYEKCFFFRRWVAWLFLIKYSKIERVLYFAFLAAWWSFRHAKPTAAVDREAQARILAIEFVSVCSFFLSFLFFFFSFQRLVFFLLYLYLY